MSRADAYGAGITNVDTFGGLHPLHDVAVNRPDGETTLITLSKSMNGHTYRIELWFKRAADHELRVEGMAGTYSEDRQPIWPVYDLEGSVRLNRNDLSPRGDEWLLLAFELDGWCAGDNAPQKGYFEIPPSALR